MTKSLLSQLEDKILVGDDCWEWTGARSRLGYGNIVPTRSYRNRMAHRVVYELLVGPIPEGLTLDHLCRNRACVRPDHLEPISLSGNILRGTSPQADNARKTHCHNGHEFTEENTWYYRRSRICRTCRGRA